MSELSFIRDTDRLVQQAVEHILASEDLGIEPQLQKKIRNCVLNDSVMSDLLIRNAEAVVDLRVPPSPCQWTPGPGQMRRGFSLVFLRFESAI